MRPAETRNKRFSQVLKDMMMGIEGITPSPDTRGERT